MDAMLNIGGGVKATDQITSVLGLFEKHALTDKVAIAAMHVLEKAGNAPVRVTGCLFGCAVDARPAPPEEPVEDEDDPKQPHCVVEVGADGVTLEDSHLGGQPVPDEVLEVIQDVPEAVLEALQDLPIAPGTCNVIDADALLKKGGDACSS